jgi:murein L,D-transpeptidase YcbB/YkuD
MVRFVFVLALSACVVAPASAQVAPQALAARLDSAGPEASALAQVYAARGHAPIWVREEGRAAALISVLRAAEAHALPASRYRPDRLAALLETDPAAAEIALSRAYLSYAADVSSGLLDPRRAASNVERAPRRPSPAALLRRAAAADDVVAHLLNLPPAGERYAGLMRRYAELRRGADWGPEVPEGAALRRGDRDPRTPLLRARLEAMGDLRAAATPPADPTLFDAQLAAGLRAFQRRHGLDDDGVLGPRTRDALNASPRERARQLAVNLERHRWMNFDRGARHILVNQPDYRVTLYDGDRVLFSERVVVGTEEHETPEFSDVMEHLVFNPSWNVPRSIATEELLPQLVADPGMLARRNMQLVGASAPADPAGHDFSQYTAATFPYRIRQRPDPNNALGRVKFMFPNDYAIYLHDTPAKELFDRNRRAFSHGCVRVRDPMRLAALLLGEQMSDPEGFIERVLAPGSERYVNLERPLPVHLIYRTAWTDDRGRTQFREDVYGRDDEVAQALRAAGVALP